MRDSRLEDIDTESGVALDYELRGRDARVKAKIKRRPNFDDKSDYRPSNKSTKRRAKLPPQE